MLFNSYTFLLFFFPIVFIGYFSLLHFKQSAYAKVFLIAGSLYFYAYFKPSYLVMLSISLILNYFLCVNIWKSKKQYIRSLMLIIGCILNVGILFYFKYFNFLINNLNYFFNTKFDTLSIILPLGISFYTFQQISFLIDTYRNENKPSTFIDYALFVTFFPQLIAGPIVLYDEVIPQFNAYSNRKISWGNMNAGLFLFSCGLAKKCFIADTLAILADTGFNSTTPLTITESWLVSLAFTLQLYFDFSGYCDMAMGIGKFFNINLPLNFNSPYKSTDFQSFWRRWHITLGRFMMKYLYIPLGGNRTGTIRTLMNLLIVFIVSGIWHGAGWLFLLWGLLHGVGILIHRTWHNFCEKYHPGWRIPKYLSIFITFFFVNLLWIFFRATTLKRTWEIITSMFNFSKLEGISKEFRIAIESYGFSRDFIFTLAAVSLIIVFLSPNSFDMNNKLEKYPKIRQILTILFFVSGFICVGRISPFLYFNF